MPRKQIKHTPERLEYIKRRIEELPPWYHKIDLGGGITTPGNNFDAIWTMTRKVLDKIDYTGKRVLDLASWDGMWAFEAEQRGAKIVVSTDIRLKGFPNLLFAREILESNIIPMCNVPVQNLPARLKTVGLEPHFDIVHHFGLFYHLRDPLLSLAQTRAVLPVGGLMILETAFIDDDANSYMAFAGVKGNRHFYGNSDTWAPTLRCLREVLLRSQFMPVKEEIWQSIEGPTKGDVKVGRIAMVAEAASDDAVTEIDLRKIKGVQ